MDRVRIGRGSTRMDEKKHLDGLLQVYDEQKNRVNNEKNTKMNHQEELDTLIKGYTSQKKRIDKLIKEYKTPAQNTNETSNERRGDNEGKRESTNKYSKALNTRDLEPIDLTHWDNYPIDLSCKRGDASDQHSSRSHRSFKSIIQTSSSMPCDAYDNNDLSGFTGMDRPFYNSVSYHNRSDKYRKHKGISRDSSKVKQKFWPFGGLEKDLLDLNDQDVSAGFGYDAPIAIDTELTDTKLTEFSELGRSQQSHRIPRESCRTRRMHDKDFSTRSIDEISNLTQRVDESLSRATMLRKDLENSIRAERKKVYQDTSPVNITNSATKNDDLDYSDRAVVAGRESTVDEKERIMNFPSIKSILKNPHDTMRLNHVGNKKSSMKKSTEDFGRFDNTDNELFSSSKIAAESKDFLENDFNEGLGLSDIGLSDIELAISDIGKSEEIQSNEVFENAADKVSKNGIHSNDKIEDRNKRFIENDVHAENGGDGSTEEINQKASDVIENNQVVKDLKRISEDMHEKATGLTESTFTDITGHFDELVGYFFLAQKKNKADHESGNIIGGLENVSNNEIWKQLKNTWNRVHSSTFPNTNRDGGDTSEGQEAFAEWTKKVADVIDNATNKLTANEKEEKDLLEHNEAIEVMKKQTESLVAKVEHPFKRIVTALPDVSERIVTALPDVSELNIPDRTKSINIDCVNHHHTLCEGYKVATSEGYRAASEGYKVASEGYKAASKGYESFRKDSNWLLDDEAMKFFGIERNNYNEGSRRSRYDRSKRSYKRTSRSARRGSRRREDPPEAY